MAGRGADYMIRGGLVVRGSGITREDIIVADGKIVENDGTYADPDIGRIIDASGHFVLPWHCRRTQPPGQRGPH